MYLEELDCDQVMGSNVWKLCPVFGFHASSVKTSNSNTKK